MRGSTEEVVELVRRGEFARACEIVQPRLRDAGSGDRHLNRYLRAYILDKQGALDAAAYLYGVVVSEKPNDESAVKRLRRTESKLAKRVSKAAPLKPESKEWYPGLAWALGALVCLFVWRSDFVGFWIGLVPMCVGVLCVRFAWTSSRGVRGDHGAYAEARDEAIGERFQDRHHGTCPECELRRDSRADDCIFCGSTLAVTALGPVGTMLSAPTTMPELLDTAHQQATKAKEMGELGMKAARRVAQSDAAREAGDQAKKVGRSAKEMGELGIEKARRVAQSDAVREAADQAKKVGRSAKVYFLSQIVPTVRDGVLDFRDREREKYRNADHRSRRMLMVKWLGAVVLVVGLAWMLGPGGGESEVDSTSGFPMIEKNPWWKGGVDGKMAEKTLEYLERYAEIQETFILIRQIRPREEIKWDARKAFGDNPNLFSMMRTLNDPDELAKTWEHGSRDEARLSALRSIPVEGVDLNVAEMGVEYATLWSENERARGNAETYATWGAIEGIVELINVNVRASQERTNADRARIGLAPLDVSDATTEGAIDSFAGSMKLVNDTKVMMARSREEWEVKMQYLKEYLPTVYGKRYGAKMLFQFTRAHDPEHIREIFPQWASENMSGETKYNGTDLGVFSGNLRTSITVSPDAPSRFVKFEVRSASDLVISLKNETSDRSILSLELHRADQIDEAIELRLRGSKEYGTTTYTHFEKGTYVIGVKYHPRSGAQGFFMNVAGDIPLTLTIFPADAEFKRGWETNRRAN